MDIVFTMLTPEQETWINHLRDDGHIEIKPYDPIVVGRFRQLKQTIQQEIGDDVDIRHCGATSLGISGQGELDVYLPVPPNQFDAMVNSVKRLFGEPGSLYPLKRARFVTFIQETRAEIFVINQEDEGWTQSVTFENHLRTHPEALDAYRKLKEEGNGLNTREYYRRKIEFINAILEEVHHETCS